jgi:hypothetical protein
LSDAELRALLLDCLNLWGVQGRVAAVEDGLAVSAAEGRFLVQRAGPDLRPVRWFLQTPERAQAGRPARAIPSIPALLTALRNALGAEQGNKLRIGAA